MSSSIHAPAIAIATPVYALQDNNTSITNSKTSNNHKVILGYWVEILDLRRKIAINPIFDKLITALTTLDKDATSYNDIFDAFRLALKFYHFGDSSEY